MYPEQIVRAWKDADYGVALAASTGAAVPPSPVGRVDVPDPALDVAGGDMAMRTEYLETLGCCQGFTQAGKCDVTAALQYCTQMCLTIFWSHWDWCQ